MAKKLLLTPMAFAATFPEVHYFGDAGTIDAADRF
jgi:hypothetical protein